MSQNSIVKKKPLFGVKQIIGIVIAIIVLVVSMSIGETEQLSVAGVRTIGMMVSFLVLLVTEAFPMPAICLLVLALLPIVGVAPSYSAALVGFSNSVVFFALASFGIAEAFANVPLSKRILKMLIRAFGKSVNGMLLAFMICAALLSSVISNLPTCVLFMTLALAFLKLYGEGEEERRTGKTFMIGIPVASFIGGLITPAGSAMNLLALSLLEQQTGLSISFVQWMALGLPAAILILPVAWFVVCRIYKPAKIDAAEIQKFADGLDVPEKINAQEAKAIIIMAIMVILWVASSWVRGIDIMVVAMIGCCVMFIPGIDLLQWKPFAEKMEWHAIILIASVLSMGGMMITNGVSGFIATLLPAINAPLFVIIGFTILFVTLMLVVVPVAPSLVTILSAPLIAFGGAMGISPQLMTLALAFAAGNSYLLPLDSVSLVTFSQGYYKMSDMAKSTAIIILWAMIVMVAIISLLAPLLGL